MITKAVSYEYPMGGQYNETVATLDDGRKVWICTQYGTADVRHSTECAISKQTSCYPKAACTCGAALSDDDKADLIADARVNGKFGRAPQPMASREEIERNQREIAEMDARRAHYGLCPKCGTFCHGDCGAQ